MADGGKSYNEALNDVTDLEYYLATGRDPYEQEEFLSDCDENPHDMASLLDRFFRFFKWR